MFIGHTKQLDYLERIINTDKIPHAFIFAGPEHLGKQLLAKMFFYSLTSQDKISGNGFFGFNNDLAGLIRRGVHPDLFLLGGKEDGGEISIADIRKLKQFVSLSPFQLARKFVLIRKAERLNRESFNSLLKTLEEPGQNTVLVLTTSQLAKIPKTITSRSVLVNFQKLTDQSLKAALKKQKLQIPDRDFAWIAGRPGLAIRYLQDPQEEEIKTLRENFFSFLELLKESSTAQKFALAQSIALQETLPIVLSAWMLACRQAMLQDKGNYLDFSKVLRELALLKQLIETTNVNRRLQLENTLLNI